MRCIFCQLDRDGSEEHVFPLAIGGPLVTDRVCEPCNSTFGSRVDAALSDNFLIRMRRADLGLAGNSGKVPSSHEILDGVATLTDNPELRVRTKFNERTNKMDIKLFHHKSSVTETGGNVSFQFIVDQKEIDTIPKIIQRERKRRGFPPATEHELNDIVRQAATNVQVRENPQVLFNLTISFQYLEHALLKIMYELAFLWLGETYLHDPRAIELRAAVIEPSPRSTDHLLNYFGEAETCGLFPYWLPNRAHHLAYSTVIDGGIVICVRVFDIFAASTFVTRDAQKYLKDSDGSEALRFLTIDASMRKMLCTSFVDEVIRVAKKAGGRQTFEPVPDPLTSSD